MLLDSFFFYLFPIDLVLIHFECPLCTEGGIGLGGVSQGLTEWSRWVEEFQSEAVGGGVKAQTEALKWEMKWFAEPRNPLDISLLPSLPLSPLPLSSLPISLSSVVFTPSPLLSSLLLRVWSTDSSQVHCPSPPLSHWKLALDESKQMLICCPIR